MTTETETDAFLRRCKNERGIAPILSSALLGRWGEIMGKSACWAWSDFQALSGGGWRLYGDTLYMPKNAEGQAIGMFGKFEMWQWVIKGRTWFSIRELRPNEKLTDTGPKRSGLA